MMDNPVTVVYCQGTSVARHFASEREPGHLTTREHYPHIATTKAPAT